MIIEEKDFKIVHEGGNFVLYSTTGSETNKSKPVGYYLQLESALRAIVTIRKDKKYTGGESYTQLSHDLRSYTKAKSDFNAVVYSIYNPISDLKKQVITY
jgi:hypothetical protein